MIKHRTINGPDIAPFSEWLVSLYTPEGKEVERVASFHNEASAEGLRVQLQTAYDHGVAYMATGPTEDLGAPLADDSEWKVTMEEAHTSLNRLEALAYARLANSLDDPSYVDLDNGTRVHLLADATRPPTTEYAYGDNLYDKKGWWPW